MIPSEDLHKGCKQYRKLAKTVTSQHHLKIQPKLEDFLTIKVRTCISKVNHLMAEVNQAM